MSDVPPFSLTKPRYDLSTYIGRVRQMYEHTDPRMLLTTDPEIKHANYLLETFKKNPQNLPPGVTNADLWHARAMREGILHPDTGQKVPALFRFSAFVPTNIVICLASLAPSTIASPMRTLLVHWGNQTYNAAINYANRNATMEISNQTLAMAYTGAVVTSCSIALGATYITKNASNLSAAAKTMVRATVPFTAVAGAGFANVALIRQKEITEGVDLSDQQGNTYGKSKIAGKLGIYKCGLARVIWNIPIMMAQPLIMDQLMKIQTIKSNKRAQIMAEVATMTACLFVGVPPALALFPQKDTIKASDVEPEFRNLKDPDGNPIELFYYNKGL